MQSNTSFQEYARFYGVINAVNWLYMLSYALFYLKVTPLIIKVSYYSYLCYFGKNIVTASRRVTFSGKACKAGLEKQSNESNTSNTYRDCYFTLLLTVTLSGMEVGQC